MKILIVGPGYPLRGGLATYDERLCKEFMDMGHSCEILSFSLQYPKILFPGKTQYSTDPAPDNLIIHSSINSVNPVNWWLTGRKFAAQKYDLVIFRYWMSFMGPSFGTIARILKKSGSRIVAITDNIIPHERKFFDKPFTSYFLNGCDAFLSMSKDVRNQAQELQPGKTVEYSPHPMYDMFGPAINKQEAIRKLGLDVNCRYLLFFGFIRKYKGLHLLLESFAKVKREGKLKLIIAGEFYEDSEPYLESISSLGLSEDVVLRTDFIPNSQVGLYFSASDMVVQTYLSATQSGVTQIAYFYDKPMLVTDVGGLAELVPDQKVGYVCSGEAEIIADKINHFYRENKETEFINGVKEEKKRFTWEYLAGKLMSI